MNVVEIFLSLLCVSGVVFGFVFANWVDSASQNTQGRRRR